MANQMQFQCNNKDCWEKQSMINRICQNKECQYSFACENCLTIHHSQHVQDTILFTEYVQQVENIQNDFYSKKQQYEDEKNKAIKKILIELEKYIAIYECPEFKLGNQSQHNRQEWGLQQWQEYLILQKQFNISDLKKFERTESQNKIQLLQQLDVNEQKILMLLGQTHINNYDDDIIIIQQSDNDNPQPTPQIQPNNKDFKFAENPFSYLKITENRAKLEYGKQKYQLLEQKTKNQIDICQILFKFEDPSESKQFGVGLYQGTIDDWQQERYSENNFQIFYQNKQMKSQNQILDFDLELNPNITYLFTFNKRNNELILTNIDTNCSISLPIQFQNCASTYICFDLSRKMTVELI